MIKKLRIVFSGIENSGKTTLAKAVAAELGYEFIEEKCRYNEDVIEGVETAETLKNIHSLQESMAAESMQGAVNGVVCDTAHMELRMWSRVKFGLDIEIESEEPIDLIFLCQTLEEFEEDSLRQLPDYLDRVEYEKEFIEFLDSEGVRYNVLPPADLDERKKTVVLRVKRLLNG